MTIDVHLIKDREQLSRLDPRAEKFHKIVREKTNEVLAEAIRSASVIKLTESPPTIAVIAVLGAIGDCVATMQSIMDEHGSPDCGDPNCPMDSIKLDHDQIIMNVAAWVSMQLKYMDEDRKKYVKTCINEEGRNFDIH